MTTNTPIFRERVRVSAERPASYMLHAKRPRISRKKDGRWRFDFRSKTYVTTTFALALRKRREVLAEYDRRQAEKALAELRSVATETIVRLGIDLEALFGLRLENIRNPEALLEILQMVSAFESELGAIEQAHARRAEIDAAIQAQPIPPEPEVAGTRFRELSHRSARYDEAGLATIGNTARGVYRNAVHDGEILDLECSRCGMLPGQRGHRCRFG